MTYIEFFEKDVSENICSSLIDPPKNVILIGSQRKLMQEHAARYNDVLASKNIFVQFICKTVNKNSLEDIISLLAEIVEEYEDCIFDLTGGDELYLVAAGIIYERYKDKFIRMHRVNIRNGKTVEFGIQKQKNLNTVNPALSIEENIRLYGGEVVYNDIKAEGTFCWDISDDFKNDILSIWDVCKRDVRLWNTQIGVFSAAEKLSACSETDLTTVVYVEHLKDYLKTVKGKFVTIDWILNALDDYGLLQISEKDDLITITYKNKQIKRCLTKAGQALEMIVFLSARYSKDKTGQAVYNDVMNGVTIDWDGKIVENNTENEIDVMMMHGLVPVFVSCKNGVIKVDELYKLSVVSDRFGGKYAKKVLITTSLNDSEFSNYIRQRAKDLNIRLIENFHELTDAQIRKVISSFWQN